MEVPAGERTVAGGLLTSALCPARAPRSPRGPTAQSGCAEVTQPLPVELRVAPRPAVPNSASTRCLRPAGVSTRNAPPRSRAGAPGPQRAALFGKGAGPPGAGPQGEVSHWGRASRVYRGATSCLRAAPGVGLQCERPGACSPPPATVGRKLRQKKPFLPSVAFVGHFRGATKKATTPLPKEVEFPRHSYSTIQRCTAPCLVPEGHVSLFLHALSPAGSRDSQEALSWERVQAACEGCVHSTGTHLGTCGEDSPRR